MTNDDEFNELDEPTYSDIEDEFDTGRNRRKPPKKIFGITPEQKAALVACGRGPGTKSEGFRDNDELKRFQAIEELAAGMDDESRMWKAWIWYRIEETARLNKQSTRVSLPELMRRIESKTGDLPRKRAIWWNDNRVRVLKKMTAAEIAGKTGVDQGPDDEMVRRAKRKNG